MAGTELTDRNLGLAIGDLGSRMGINGLALPAEGALNLTVGEFPVALERSADRQRLLVTASRALTPHETHLVAKALEASSFAASGGEPFTASYAGDTLMLTTHIDPDDLSAGAIERAILSLVGTLGRIAQ